MNPTFYYHVEDEGDGIYSFEQFDRRDCSSLIWKICMNYFAEGIQHPSEADKFFHAMMYSLNPGNGFPPDGIWHEFLSRLPRK